MTDRRVLRRYDLDRPRPMAAEFHVLGCDCAACEPPVPSIPSRLDAQAHSKLTLAGAAFGTAVAMALEGPAAIGRVLWAALTWQPL